MRFPLLRPLERSHFLLLQVYVSVGLPCLLSGCQIDLPAASALGGSSLLMWWKTACKGMQQVGWSRPHPRW